jgi:hypothetical protein
MKRLASLLLAALLVGCYAETEWRELYWPEGQVKALFPAKPAKFSREVRLAGANVPMEMLQVQMKGMAFGVAYSPLPPAPAADVLASARDVLLKNIEGGLVSEREVAVPGATGMGREFRGEGVVAGTPMIVAARLATSGDRFYEAVFIGRKDRAETVDLDLFLGSLKIGAQ